MTYAKLTNNQIKKYASLKYKKYRRQFELFIADGIHPVEEAIKSGWPIERVIVRQDTLNIARSLGVNEDLLVMARAPQFAKISTSKSPQGMLAVLKTIDRSDIIVSISKSANRLIACDNISDPGNLGTIIRTAAAFNYDAVILIGNCADIYNPKTVMATQGGIFKLPIIEMDSADSFIDSFNGNFSLICFSGNYETPLSAAPVIDKPLLILGGETSGISSEIKAIARYHLKIEQSDKIDSLNVSVAAGIAMYQISLK